MTQPTNPPNVSTTAGSAAVVMPAPLPAGLTPEQRDYYLIRWRALLLELRYIADMMGWADRLPPR